MLLGQDLKDRSNTVVMITEPYTYGGKIAGLPGGSTIVYARGKKDGPPPRAGILASSNVQITAMDSWCNRDCAVALTRINGRQTIVISLYLDIKTEVQPKWLDDLMDMIDGKKYPVVLTVTPIARYMARIPTQEGMPSKTLYCNMGLRLRTKDSHPLLKSKGATKWYKHT